MFSLCLIATLSISVSCQQKHPRMVSWPSHPLIGKNKDNVLFDWKFELQPTETWKDSIFELIFGVWRSPGYLKKKLVVINKRGEVLIRPKYENKVSCKFNMSRLQVAFTLHNLSMEDEKHYGIHVEFGLDQSPLTDDVMLRLEDPPKITNPLQRNITLSTGEDLDLKCQASGVPDPVVTWTRLGRVIKNQNLIFKRVTTSDSGRYLCKANNQAGNDSKEIIVTVSDFNDMLPQITVHSTPTSSEEISPVLTSLMVICILSILTLTVLLLCSRRYCRRNSIPYERQIDTATNTQHVLYS
ncbi:hypothetical protein ACROYT_G017745 [Oculina patagonica]